MRIIPHFQLIDFGSIRQCITSRVCGFLIRINSVWNLFQPKATTYLRALNPFFGVSRVTQKQMSALEETATTTTAEKKTNDNKKKLSSISPDIINGPPIPADEWPDRPILLCTHPRHKKYIHTKPDMKGAIPINQVFDIESKAFKGKCIMRIVDMPTTDKKYFQGRRRKSDNTIQACFNFLFSYWVRHKSLD